MQPAPLTPVPQNQNLPALTGNANSLPSLDLGRIAGAFLRRSWIAVLCAVALAVVVGFWVLSLPEIYRSTAVVYVGKEKENISDIKGVTSRDFGDLEELKSIEQSFTSATLLLRVIESNGLHSDPTFVEPKEDGTRYADAEMVNILSDRLGVSLRRGTRLIEISVEDTDPVRARKLAKSLVDEYDTLRNEQELNRIRKGLESLNIERERLDKKLATSEEALQAFRDANTQIPVDAEEFVLQGKLRALNEELSKARAEHLRYQTEVEKLEAIDSSDLGQLLSIGTIRTQETVISLEKAIDVKEGEFARVKMRYLYKHPNYIHAESQLADLKISLAKAAAGAADGIRQKLSVARENEAKLIQAVSEQNTVIAEATRQLAPYLKLKREAEADRDLFDSLMKRIKETAVTEGIEEGLIREMGAPLVPVDPVKPNRKLFVALAFLGGGALGVMIILLLDLLDQRLRGSSHIEQMLGIPVLATVPKGQFKKLEDSIAMKRNPYSPMAESFRLLRASVAAIGNNRQSRSVLFTSARPGEGKSICALNYAVSLAKQGYRTLLIDADLRRPAVTKALMQFDSAGLSDYLDGKIKPAQACFETEFENLYLFGGGSPHPNPGELLSDQRLPLLISEAYRWFDRVVIDSSPLGVVSDAITLSRAVQQVCVVIDHGKTKRRDLVAACRLLSMAGANIAGFVLNRAPKTESAMSAYNSLYQPGKSDPVLALASN
ncbi:polysaccharide biosynthesis tyrosine autokinase [Arenicella sp.]|nr:polysaccharide biosynthesis tyrosine autokinase [Arenicella sp.]